MIHHFEITADLEPEDAAELLAEINSVIAERDGTLLSFFAAQKDEDE